MRCKKAHRSQGTEVEERLRLLLMPYACGVLAGLRPWGSCVRSNTTGTDGNGGLRTCRQMERRPAVE
jgi:hypothetical protein